MANAKRAGARRPVALVPDTRKSAFKTRNDLDADTRKRMIKLLNQQLADTLDLMSQTKHAHWNVKGPNFIGLHKMFDEFVDGLEDYIDVIAERATALGGPAAGTLRMAASASRLPDFPSDVVNDLDVVTVLADRFAAVGASTRRAVKKAEDADDQDTMDLFVDASRDLDKWLWFLEAHLQA
jgi:starvation-inducible DNA-binding protein